MRLRVPYEIMQVEGQTFAVPMEEIHEGFGGVVKLSKTAAVIFDLLQQDTTVEEIVEELRRRFDAPEDILAADVHGVLARFQEKGLLL